MVVSIRNFAFQKWNRFLREPENCRRLARHERKLRRIHNLPLGSNASNFGNNRKLDAIAV